MPEINLWIAIATIGIAVFVGVTLLYIRPRTKKLRAQEIQFFLKKLEDTYHVEPSFGIIQVDTIIENILRAKGGHGSLGNMLRMLPKGNITNTLWKYHKIRNILVHEAQGVCVTKKDVENYIDVAKSLLRK